MIPGKLENYEEKQKVVPRYCMLCCASEANDNSPISENVIVETALFSRMLRFKAVIASTRFGYVILLILGPRMRFEELLEGSRV